MVLSLFLHIFFVTLYLIYSIIHGLRFDGAYCYAAYCDIIDLDFTSFLANDYFPFVLLFDEVILEFIAAFDDYMTVFFFF